MNTNTRFAHVLVRIQYKKRVELELTQICKEVLTLLEDKLLKSNATRSAESNVFYLKMCETSQELFLRALSGLATTTATSPSSAPLTETTRRLLR